MGRTIGCVAVGVALALMLSNMAWAGYYEEKEMMPSPQYVEQEGEMVVFPYGIMARNVAFQTVGSRLELAPIGGPYTVSSFFDIFTEVSTDSGGTWLPFAAHADPATMRFNVGGGGGGVDLYNAEMLSLNIMGEGPFAGVMIRESPTLASPGQTTCTDLAGGGGGGGYKIDSFFDVFTEISIDGGQTWMPSQQSMHITGTPEPATLSLLILGGLGVLLRRKRK